MISRVHGLEIGVQGTWFRRYGVRVRSFSLPVDVLIMVRRNKSLLSHSSFSFGLIGLL